jgi:hypothetical protein
MACGCGPVVPSILPGGLIGSWCAACAPSWPWPAVPHRGCRRSPRRADRLVVHGLPVFVAMACGCGPVVPSILPGGLIGSWCAACPFSWPWPAVPLRWCRRSARRACSSSPPPPRSPLDHGRDGKHQRPPPAHGQAPPTGGKESFKPSLVRGRKSCSQKARGGFTFFLSPPLCPSGGFASPPGEDRRGRVKIRGARVSFQVSQGLFIS